MIPDFYFNVIIPKVDINYKVDRKFMRHFDYLASNEEQDIFFVTPESFNRDSDKNLIAHALGATLYMPATRETIADDITGSKYKGLMTIVICLEDAIGDKQVEEAEEWLFKHLEQIREKGVYNKLPFIFIRVRDAMQMQRIAEKIDIDSNILTGFVFPKFEVSNSRDYLSKLDEINKKSGKKLYCMPVLETEDIIYKERRSASLDYMADLFEQYNDLVLNIRVGATDFSNLFGIRRSEDVTIYDIAVIRDCICDVVNRFVRYDKEYVVSGPVWEYFHSRNRVLIPQLRHTPFRDSYGGSTGERIRKKLLDDYTDGLLHEVLLDKANGFWGKTIIHPSHIIPVQSLYVVTHEEYMDARAILQNDTGEIGVMKSQYFNKMNEVKTHINWAKKIITRAKVYGVYNEGKFFTDLLQQTDYMSVSANN